MAANTIPSFVFPAMATAAPAPGKDTASAKSGADFAAILRDMPVIARGAGTQQTAAQPQSASAIAVAQDDPPAASAAMTTDAPAATPQNSPCDAAAIFLAQAQQTFQERSASVPAAPAPSTPSAASVTTGTAPTVTPGSAIPAIIAEATGKNPIAALANGWTGSKSDQNPIAALANGWAGSKSDQNPVAAMASGWTGKKPDQNTSSTETDASADAAAIAMLFQVAAPVPMAPPAQLQPVSSDASASGSASDGEPSGVFAQMASLGQRTADRSTKNAAVAIPVLPFQKQGEGQTVPNAHVFGETPVANAESAPSLVEIARAAGMTIVEPSPVKQTPAAPASAPAAAGTAPAAPERVSGEPAAFHPYFSENAAQASIGTEAGAGAATGVRASRAPSLTQTPGPAASVQTSGPGTVSETEAKVEVVENTAGQAAAADENAVAPEVQGNGKRGQKTAQATGRAIQFENAKPSRTNSNSQVRPEISAKAADPIKEGKPSGKETTDERGWQKLPDSRIQATPSAPENFASATAADLGRAGGAFTSSDNPRPAEALPGVVRSTIEAIPNPIKSTTIEIQPEGCGKIQIRVAVRTSEAGQTCRVDIRTSDPAAHALLNTHLDELRQTLKTDLVSIASLPSAPAQPVAVLSQNEDRQMGQRGGRQPYEQPPSQQGQSRGQKERFTLFDEESEG